MPESYVFATIREMINDTSHFLPVSLKDYYAWCKTYAFFVKKMYPSTYKVMEKCGALNPEGLDPIFKRFFITILKREVSYLMVSRSLLCILLSASYLFILWSATMHCDLTCQGCIAFHGYILVGWMQSNLPTCTFLIASHKA